MNRKRNIAKTAAACLLCTAVLVTAACGAEAVNRNLITEEAGEQDRKSVV